jgi:hypothetical protein
LVIAIARVPQGRLNSVMHRARKICDRLLTVWAGLLASGIMAADSTANVTLPPGGALAGDRHRVLVSTDIGGTIKMGDTPSVAWLLRGTPDDPSKPGWGGQFVRAWQRPYPRLSRLPTEEDRMEVFGILELALPLGDKAPAKPEARLIVENQSLVGHFLGDGTVRFRFSPKTAQSYRFRIQSNLASLDGQTGGITAVPPAPEIHFQPTANHANWWTDDPSPAAAEGEHPGAKTVNRWREDFLRDFALRMKRCLPTVLD